MNLTGSVKLKQLNNKYNFANMLLSELFLLVCFVSFASFDSLVHSPMSGNKYGR